MLLSQRDTSPLHCANASNASSNNFLGLTKQSSERRLGSAIHRIMFRTSTEQNLFSARNMVDVKLTDKKAEIKIGGYQRASTQSTVPSTSRGSKFEPKSRIRKKMIEKVEIIEDKKQIVKVEYSSNLGTKETQKVLISKWVDYSSKYGIGYKLSNGCYGVLYNDSTKMILNQN